VYAVERMFATDGVSKFHRALPSILVVPTKPLLPSGDHAAAFHAVKDPSKTDAEIWVDDDFRG